MNLQALQLSLTSGPLTQAVRALVLEPGSQLVARVLQAPPEGGQGMIALAGTTVQARLPKGVEPGQTLRLEVVRVESDSLTVRIRPEQAGSADPAALAQAAGRLAVTGDGDMMRAALALAGDQPLWLPDGGAATLEVDPDEQGEAKGGGRAAGVAAFCLHSPTLGAIEVRLTLAPGGVRAGVVTAAGDAATLARDGIAELAERLSNATGVPAAVAVNERAATTPPPTPPAGRVDVQV